MTSHLKRVLLSQAFQPVLHFMHSFIKYLLLGLVNATQMQLKTKIKDLNTLKTQLRLLVSISMWANELTLFPDQERSQEERASPETASSFSPSVEMPGALPAGHHHRPQPRSHLQHFLIQFWSLVSLHRWPSLRRHSATHWRMNNSRISAVRRVRKAVVFRGNAQSSFTESGTSVSWCKNVNVNNNN